MKDELSKALFQMANNKSPGFDGLTSECFKVFWTHISDTFYLAILHCIKYGRLTKSMRQGLLSLIPKKERDPIWLKNWRPLTLMNVDHKIYAKAITNRMKSGMTYLIGEQQTDTYLEGSLE